MTTRLDDRHIRDEPSVLDADMTRDDLVWTLQHLNFGRNNRTDRRQLAHICVDRTHFLSTRALHSKAAGGYWRKRPAASP